MQFFGARANLAKTLLYAINGGVDEVTGAQVGPEYRPITSEVLDFEEVKHNFMNRANLAKTLLYAINGGVDEVTGAQVGPEYRPITSEVLDFEEVKHNFMNMMDWLAELYVNTLNIIHYMHDKYSYEAAQLALMDSDLQRTFATGNAGISHAADS